ncbi:MAG TPA: SOS response-associated peptidase [Acidimicrobiales bacterium]|nr:SOS response-associated peptidase [Acidimicrobiales bacterium]
MCGRYTSTTPAAVLASTFAVDEVAVDALDARWNVAPTTDVPVVATRSSGARVLGTMRWGLVPPWARGPEVGARMINARAEGLASRAAFRAPLARRRCIVPADAFYEWQAAGAGGRRAPKVPWAFARLDGAPMAFAGLWETWRDPAAGPGAPALRTWAVVTTAANACVARVHHRMPVVLGPGQWDRWLAPEPLDADELAAVCAPAPDAWFSAWPVGTAVNHVANDGPTLLEPAPRAPSPTGSDTPRLGL